MARYLSDAGSRCAGGLDRSGPDRVDLAQLLGGGLCGGVLAVGLAKIYSDVAQWVGDKMHVDRKKL